LSRVPRVTCCVSKWDVFVFRCGTVLKIFKVAGEKIIEFSKVKRDVQVDVHHLRCQLSNVIEDDVFIDFA
jgi:hypothetical protein